MLTQNRFRQIILKNDFSTTTAKYREALKYYGYGELNKLALTNCILSPYPVLKNSRTLTKQASLPRLTVPELKNSIDRYLNAVKPFLNENEFNKTTKIATEFVKEKGLGEKLQSLLVQKSKTTDNWLAQWWLDKIYLEPRYNLIINVSPAIIYPKENFNSTKDQIEFAAKYLIGFLEFKNNLDNQNLPVEKLGDSTLCMDQYYKLLGTCRIPNSNKDEILIMQTYSINLEKTNHVLVMYKNRFFTLQLIDPNTGLRVSNGEILHGLSQIVNSTKEYGIGLGLMTAENRDQWCATYNKLSFSEKNRKNFDKIFNSLFVLCLDDDHDEPQLHDNSQMDKKSTEASRLLHGNKKYTANRWFDKTVQVIIGKNGYWGVNFEHTVAEGVPHAFMNDFIYNYIKTNQENMTLSQMNDNSSTTTNRVDELKFDISADTLNTLCQSATSINKFIDSLDLNILDFEYYGKNFPKSQKVSPDAYVQVALQLAFFRAHSKLGNAYESGSLRRYYLGRTEIIRSCSADAAEFVRAMSDENLSEKGKAALLLKAISSHRQYTNSAMNCESFDRHLLGLKLIALENNIEVPDLYRDEAFSKLCHYYVSSSQISSKFEAVTVFGPAVHDGYGICYNIMEKKLLFGITSNKECQTTNPRLFANQIKQALLDCQALLLKVNSKL